MSQFNPQEFIYYVRDGKRAYYSYDGELYAAHFPEEWAQNHEDCTGPKYCGNCAYFGHWNGVFIGYCGNCAKHVYKGERGRGFIDVGKENDDEIVLDYKSVFSTYLRGVGPNDIGDPELYDSSAIVNSFEASFTAIEEFILPEGGPYDDNIAFGDIDCGDIGVGVGYTIDRNGKIDAGYESN